MSLTRNVVDRLVGAGVTVFVCASLFVLQLWLKQRKERLLRAAAAPAPGTWRKAAATAGKGAKAGEEDRGQGAEDGDDDKVWHDGSCHCGRVVFAVRAPRKLHAVDVPSRIRFPRLSLQAQDFALLRGQRALQVYCVSASTAMVVGLHAFCRHCGVHVMHAECAAEEQNGEDGADMGVNDPSQTQPQQQHGGATACLPREWRMRDPQAVHVNAECLDLSQVQDLTVAFYHCAESMPLAVDIDDDNEADFDDALDGEDLLFAEDGQQEFVQEDDPLFLTNGALVDEEDDADADNAGRPHTRKRKTDPGLWQQQQRREPHADKYRSRPRPVGDGQPIDSVAQVEQYARNLQIRKQLEDELGSPIFAMNSHPQHRTRPSSVRSLPTHFGGRSVDSDSILPDRQDSMGSQFDENSSHSSCGPGAEMNGHSNSNNGAAPEDVVGDATTPVRHGTAATATAVAADHGNASGQATPANAGADSREESLTPLLEAWTTLGSGPQTQPHLYGAGAVRRSRGSINAGNRRRSSNQSRQRVSISPTKQLLVGARRLSFTQNAPGFLAHNNTFYNNGYGYSNNENELVRPSAVAPVRRRSRNSRSGRLSSSGMRRANHVAPTAHYSQPPRGNNAFYNSVNGGGGQYALVQQQQQQQQPGAEWDSVPPQQKTWSVDTPMRDQLRYHLQRYLVRNSGETEADPAHQAGENNSNSSSNNSNNNLTPSGKLHQPHQGESPGAGPEDNLSSTGDSDAVDDVDAVPSVGDEQFQAQQRQALELVR